MRTNPLLFAAVLVALLGFLAARVGVSHVVAAGFTNADRWGWAYAFAIVVAALVYVLRALARTETTQRRTAVAR